MELKDEERRVLAVIRDETTGIGSSERVSHYRIAEADHRTVEGTNAILSGLIGAGFVDYDFANGGVRLTALGEEFAR